MPLTAIRPSVYSESRTLLAEPLRARPFLKWAGGKKSLLPILRQLTPPRFSRYLEPFLGGGAMFFNLRPSVAVLSDANRELMNCYVVVRDQLAELIEELSNYQISEVEYYRVRALKPEDLSPAARAARLIYLNKACFNGLYRVNRTGQFNTPFGHYSNVRLVDEETLSAASVALKDTVLSCADYEMMLLEQARKGDFIYLDPPYLPVSASADFKRYTPIQFYEADHVRLAHIFRALDTRGCYVLLSNSYHQKIKEFYRAYRMTITHAPRFINCKGGNRGAVQELLVTNY